MKTIFDKVDPKYIECGTGVCEHVSHSHIMPLYIVAVILLFTVIIKLKSKSY